MIKLRVILEDIEKKDFEKAKREDVILSRNVKEKLQEVYKDEIEFLKATTVITTQEKGTQEKRAIPIPNQYFKLGAMVSELYANLRESRDEVIEILNEEYSKNGNIEFNGREHGKKENFKTLFNSIKKFYDENISKDKSNRAALLLKIKNNLSFIEGCSNRESETDDIVEFISDYSFWHGGRTLDRTSDYTGSAISTILKIQQTSSEIILKIIDNIIKVDIVDEILTEIITEIIDKEPHNLIVFGAPGTGKSYSLKEKSTKFKNNYLRVTFHPSYSYAQFVGSYKPVSDKDNKGNDIIRYEYVPGPFMKVFVNAQKSSESWLLIIEEINRANVASVFGDTFQLLDRNEDGKSEYEIETSNEMREYLQKELGGTVQEYQKIRIPSNMYIWGTMNSADQGVFPMDTAFKRRWDFKYIGIDENMSEIKNIDFICGKDAHIVNWNELREKINKRLLEYNVNEDKLLGPFFISKRILEEGKIERGTSDFKRNEEFLDKFKNKVIMYLFEDAVGRQRRNEFFNFEGEVITYSKICEKFDEVGEQVFGIEIKKLKDE